jgi:hypothetical protein
MSLLDRFRRHTTDLPEASADEHQAVVELLVLAAYADDAVTDAEFEELAQFDAGHVKWDEQEFSVLQHLPVAIAKARKGQTVSDLAGRLSTPAIRAEAAQAFASLLTVDGMAKAESDFLYEVQRALA